MVGSRKVSPYGAQVCKELISGLKGTNIVIVSGLALGIDSIAHQAALDAGLKTVAVLGSGLDWSAVYPRSHIPLAKEIIESGGAIISEENHFWKPQGYNFPKRNRIMAGLSHTTLIIEANLKSGTLITAKMALDYNRDVCAVPGSIFSEKSEGPHMLIKNGATPITNSVDLLNILGINSDSLSKARKVLKNCSELEKRIYEVLDEPMSRTDLLRKIEADVKDVSVALSLLEMRGFIEENGGIFSHQQQG